MEILERLLEIYYRYHTMFLNLALIILTVGLEYGIKSVEDEEEKVGQQILKGIFYSITAICVGYILYVSGMLPEIEYPYFNGMIFLLAEGLVICYGTLNSIFYRKSWEPLVQASRNTGFVVVFELFLLAATGKLELVEGVVGMFALSLSGVIPLAVENGEEEEEISVETDYPNPDLFAARRRQLKQFCRVLEQQAKEPYAIMIDGPWGSGKTSFVKALEKELYQDEFIWIYAGSEKTVSEILEDLSDEILKALRKNHVFVEKGGVIEKYFMAFSGIMNDFGIDFLSQIVKLPGTEEEDREYLNGKLKKLNKMIYIVVDDLDRCGREYQEKMFKVIRESTELVNCKTLFLVDRRKFLAGDDFQIEKYISYKLELCGADYQEVVEHVIEPIISDSFVSEMSPILRRQRQEQDIREEVYHLPERNCALIEAEIEETENAIRSNKYAGEELVREKEKIEDLKAVVNEIKENIQNPRKTKNFLKDIRRMTENLNGGLERASEEFQTADWFGTILDVLLVKHFLPQLYAEIKESRSFEEFGDTYKGYSADILLKLTYGFVFPDEKRMAILDELIYRIDSIDFDEIRTEREELLQELYGTKPDRTHMDKYLKNAWNMEDMKKIWDLYEKEPYEDVSERTWFLGEYLDVFSGKSRGMLLASADFRELSEKISLALVGQKLSEKERNICEYHGRRIARMTLWEKSQELKNVLYAVLGLKKVEAEWGSMPVDLEDMESMFKRLDGGYKAIKGEAAPERIATYYEQLFAKLQGQEIGVILSEEQEELKNAFLICSLWYHMSENLKKNTIESGAAFKRYFMQERGGFVKKEAFLNVDELKIALKVLYDFYEQKNEKYQSDDTYLLMELSKGIVWQFEEDISWFAGKEQEIMELLQQLLRKVQALDKLETAYAKDVMQVTELMVCLAKKYSEN